MAPVVSPHEYAIPASGRPARGPVPFLFPSSVLPASLRRSGYGQRPAVHPRTLTDPADLFGPHSTPPYAVKVPFRGPVRPPSAPREDNIRKNCRPLPVQPHGRTQPKRPENHGPYPDERKADSPREGTAVCLPSSCTLGGMPRRDRFPGGAARRPATTGRPGRNTPDRSGRIHHFSP